MIKFMRFRKLPKDDIMFRSTEVSNESLVDIFQAGVVKDIS